MTSGLRLLHRSGTMAELGDYREGRDQEAHGHVPPLTGSPPSVDNVQIASFGFF